MKIKVFASIVMGLGISLALAYGDYINMRKIDAERIDYSWAKCYYSPSYGGNENYVISIVVKGSVYSCPYSIKYYPASGTWE